MLRLFIFALAIASGGGAAYLVSTETSQVAPAEVAPVGPPTADVLVANADILRGQRIDARSLTWQAFPENAVADDFIVRNGGDGVEAQVGQFAKRAFVEGEPIRAAAFTDRANGYLSGKLEPGMRAVAIQTSAQNSAGGFILPEDRVDVLHTYNMRSDLGIERIITETLLQGVRVLAIDQTTSGSDEHTVVGKTATLELTRGQAEAVTAAEAMGDLSLSLRPVGEVADEYPLLAARDPVVEAPEVEAPEVETADARTVRIIRPDGVETVTLN